MNAISHNSPARTPARQTTDLSFAEQLMLWAMRLWVVGYRLNNSPDDQLAKALRNVGIGEGRQRLEEFMVAITAGAARGIGVCCVCQKEIGEDEHLLLDVLRLSQPQFARAHGAFLLEDVLTARALPIAAVKAQALAAAFNAAGLHFPVRTAEAPPVHHAAPGMSHASTRH